MVELLEEWVRVVEGMVGSRIVRQFLHTEGLVRGARGRK